MRPLCASLCSALLLLGCGEGASVAPIPVWLQPETDGGTVDGGRDAGDSGFDAGPPDAGHDAGFDAGVDAGVKRVQELNFFYVHGAAVGNADRRVAHDQLYDLQRHLELNLPDRVSLYEIQRFDVRLAIRHVRANLYTDSANQLLSPSVDALSDSTGVAAGNQWRTRLAEELEERFDGGERNIVIIAHGIGAKASLELAASDAGAAPRIAGVVAMHAMVDSLQDSTYDVNGNDDYVTTCKGSRDPGYCEYSGLIDSTVAANRVATRKRSLVIIGGGGSCPSGWTAVDDGVVPLRAQGSPDSFGMSMTAASSETHLPAHGVRYGEYCHTDLIEAGTVAHVAATEAAGELILRWLFEASSRVTTPGMANSPVNIASLNSGTFSSSQQLTAGCPAGETDEGPPQVEGVCVHPGFTDGDDHPFDGNNEVQIVDGATCGGSYRWRHLHSGDSHAAKIWAKTYSQLPGLVSALPVRP